jgi:hypothetical protein
MSNPKEQREKIALIEDLLKCPGYTEWFVPEVEKTIRMLEAEICDVSTSPEETARKKIERTVWIAMLMMPAEMQVGCRNNIKSFVDGVKRTPPEA